MVELNETNINKITEVICETYQKFNGFINPVNPSGGLIIMPFYASPMNKLASTNGYVVKIYPLNIFWMYGENWKAAAIYTVLHELSHMDQDINFYLYAQDPNYAKAIENTNDINTAHFILNSINSDSIIDIDVTTMATQILQNTDLYSEHNQYRSISIQRVYGRTFESLLNKAGFFTDFSSNMLDTFKNLNVHDSIVFTIKDENSVIKIPICKNKFWFSPEFFNDMIYQYLYQYDMVRYTISTTLKKDDKLDIRLIIKEKRLNPFIEL